VGAPFLLQRDLEIALAEKELRFFKPVGCDGAHLAYWDANAVAIPFESHWDRSPNPHFKVEINGKELDAIIDTGASTTVIDARAAKRIGLRLDAPNVQRNGNSAGIGERHVERFSTVVDKLKIGGETINNAQLGIIDTEGSLSADMLLGADFLRAHRVLFALSQKQLYITYVGGEPLGQRRTLESWMVQEAEAGNPDAQVALSEIYAAGRLVPRDQARAGEWLEKAAAQGQPRANLLLGRKLMLSGARWEEAAKRMSGALEQLPAERYGPLWLYIARVRMGDAANAKRGLEKALARDQDRQWPAPIADFYLGRIDAAALMAAAGKDEKLSKSRTCQATGYMAEWHAAQGDDASARALGESRRAQCGAPAQPPRATPQA
jgi:clan AA aspartic protease (TIGR02281 family)